MQPITPATLRQREPSFSSSGITMDSGDGGHSVGENDDSEAYCGKGFTRQMLMIAQNCHQLVKDPIFDDEGIQAVEAAAATLKVNRKRANIAKLAGAVAGIAGNITVIAWKISSGSSSLLSLGIVLVVLGVIVTIASDFAFQLCKWKVVQSVKDTVEDFIEACLFLEAEERFYTTLFQNNLEKGRCYEDDEKVKEVGSFDFHESRKDLERCADELKMNKLEYPALGRFFVSICAFVRKSYNAFNEVEYQPPKSEKANQHVVAMLETLQRERSIILNIFIVINEMGVALTLTVLSGTDYVERDPETNQIITSLERSYLKAALRRKVWGWFWRSMNVFNLLVNVATLFAVSFSLARKSPDEVAELFSKISTGMLYLVKTDMEKRKALNSTLLDLGLQ